jgi:hypothetical protein
MIRNKRGTCVYLPRLNVLIIEVRENSDEIFGNINDVRRFHNLRFQAVEPSAYFPLASNEVEFFE